MGWGKVLVEQVNKDGNIVFDYDYSLSVYDIFIKLKTYFPNIQKDPDGFIVGSFKGKKFSIRIKNITYLGNPHPLYKKRIQIPTDLQDFYKISIKKGYKPLLLGVYSHNDNIIFCDFNIDDFINKKAHNSSAHVYTSDLSAASAENFFQKTDYFGNKITAFTPDVVDVFLKDKLFVNYSEREFFNELIRVNRGIKDDNTITQQYDQESLMNLGNEEFDKILEDTITKKKNNSNNIVDCFWGFFENETKDWHGIECYTAMIQDNYRNKFQPEWAGFYLEYEFEKYINDNKLSHIVRYAQEKGKNGIDLDLFFPIENTYGDLKAHSSSSRGIQGNDWITVFEAIKRFNHIYYIVCEHSTVKDSECGYEVTKFWNTVQKKPNIMSYSTRMKNSVKLEKAYILDINSENAQYLSVFKQGINSNGSPRAPKIMIEHDKLSHFMIAEKNL